jgi:hypothetical protein
MSSATLSFVDKRQFLTVIQPVLPIHECADLAPAASAAKSLHSVADSTTAESTVLPLKSVADSAAAKSAVELLQSITDFAVVGAMSH